MASAATTNTTVCDAVGTATVSGDPQALVDRAQTLRFVFPNFRAMGRERFNLLPNHLIYISPPSLDAFGYLWTLEIFTKGLTHYYYKDGIITVFLKYMGDAEYTPSAKIVFRIKDMVKSVPVLEVFDKKTCRRRKGITPHDFLTWQKIIVGNHLENDGSLIIEVDIQITTDSKRVWYPKTIPIDTSLKESYTEALPSSNNPTEEDIKIDTTDIVFVVDNEHFPVHKSVLSIHAKTLFALYNDTTRDDKDNDDGDDRARVLISDINSDTFKKFIEFIYTVNTTPTLVDAATAIELLLVAHRFECVSLKLYVESVLVDKFVTPTNAASMLLLGDTYHCALLKEVALHSSFADPTSFRESSSDPAAWSNILDSHRLLSELYVYTNNKIVATRNPNTSIFGAVSQDRIDEDDPVRRSLASAVMNTNAGVVEGEDDTTRTIDVCTLRERLGEANLGLDGSREMLVTRLRDYHHQH